MSSSELAVRVRAPSRLHFGLLAFGESAPRRFGGVGVMIDKPETEILASLRPHGESPSEQPRGGERRALEFAERFRLSCPSRDDRERLEQVQIQVTKAAAEHVGIGSGTQLAMAVGRALAAFIGKSDLPPSELAQRVGRGCRSAIGVHGFNCGGFIVEGGKTDPSQISPLIARLNFPSDWQFVLVIPKGFQGLHGPAEREAFDSLPPIPLAVTADLCRLTMLGMLPAVAERDFPVFSDSLAEFGRKVGQCFTAHQTGVYASPLAETVLNALAQHGVHGVAQSSWGPTLAAVCDSRFRAEWLAARLVDTLPSDTLIFTTPPNNLGAKIEVVNYNLQ
jgi:beta-RFAP synthase